MRLITEQISAIMKEQSDHASVISSNTPRLMDI